LFLQESGWLYAGVNTAHVLGIALLVGAIVVLDLRLLGLWRRIPVAMLGPPAVAVASAGLGLAILSGAALFAVQATEYVANPFLYVKFGAILVGLVNVAALRLAGDWRDDSLGRRRAVAGFLSLLAWLAALTAGRLIAYW
jgi:hypothetical protein